MAFVIVIVVIALVFDFINGFHDSANSISTVVSTRVLSPKYAVLWAAFFNFIAAFFIGTQVANTIGRGIIHPDIVDNMLILSALGGAIIWNLITWYYGLPSSSSHALIGGLIGAGIAKSGTSSLVWAGVIKTTAFIILSPAIGLVLGYIFMVISLNLNRNSNMARSEKLYRKLQLCSSAIYSLGHGMNDAQKTMGIIAIVLYSKGLIGSSFNIPYWIIIMCYTVIALGTMFGGWRIVKTMGTKITKLRPIGGFSAEAAAAVIDPGGDAERDRPGAIQAGQVDHVVLVPGALARGKDQDIRALLREIDAVGAGEHGEPAVRAGAAPRPVRFQGRQRQGRGWGKCELEVVARGQGAGAGAVGEKRVNRGHRRHHGGHDRVEVQLDEVGVAQRPMSRGDRRTRHGGVRRRRAQVGVEVVLHKRAGVRRGAGQQQHGQYRDLPHSDPPILSKGFARDSIGPTACVRGANQATKI